MTNKLKEELGRVACDYVKPGMRLGIGSGSTAEAFVRALGNKVAEGLEIVGVPTSERTASLCRNFKIPLTTLDEMPQLDLTIDGADEIDQNLSLIKGAGGAMLREKIVAAASKSMYVIADESKLVERLGAFALPIEVNAFGLGATKIAIEKLAQSMKLAPVLSLRAGKDGDFVSDGGHLVLDASFGLIEDANALDKALLAIPGVVQHGLFIDIADKAIVAGVSGIRILDTKRKS